MIKIPYLDELKRDPKKMTIATIAGSALVIGAFVFFLVIPQAGKLGKVMTDHKNKKADLEAAREEISRVDAYKADIAKFGEKVDMYEKKLPLEQEMPSILENMNEMAKRSRLDIIAITPASSQNVRSDNGQKAAYQEFLIRLSMRCGYHELGRVLSAMENADRFMKVVDIDIKGDENAPKKHSVEMLIATYILLKDKDKDADKDTDKDAAKEPAKSPEKEKK
jgi:Tfp pilus assembly protein PilO